jgi:hypothetical protein
MHRWLLRALTAAVLALGAACATTPEDHSSADAHDAAVKTHLEFARDFKEAGNDAMYRYHFEKAATEQQKKEDEECGLFCTLIDVLLDTKPKSENVLGKSCRDPVTNPPSGPPRC